MNSYNLHDVAQQRAEAVAFIALGPHARLRRFNTALCAFPCPISLSSTNAVAISYPDVLVAGRLRRAGEILSQKSMRRIFLFYRPLRQPNSAQPPFGHTEEFA